MKKSTYKKKLKKHHKKHNKTRKLIKKGGDIMYYPSPEANQMWSAEPPMQNLICSDDKVCLAFGEVSDHVKAFFDGFTRFNFTNKVIKRIGNPSVNGFVFELENETYLKSYLY